MFTSLGFYFSGKIVALKSSAYMIRSLANVFSSWTYHCHSHWKHCDTYWCLFGSVKLQVARVHLQTRCTAKHFSLKVPTFSDISPFPSLYQRSRVSLNVPVSTTQTHTGSSGCVGTTYKPFPPPEVGLQTGSSSNRPTLWLPATQPLKLNPYLRAPNERLHVSACAWMCVCKRRKE